MPKLGDNSKEVTFQKHVFGGVMLPEPSCFTFRWITLILVCALSTAGCSELPPLQPAETPTSNEVPTASPVMSTETSFSGTQTPSLEESLTPVPQTPPGETQISSLEPSPALATETQSGETPTPSLEPSPMQSTETQTSQVTLTQSSPTETQTPDPSTRIPAQSEWVDYGIILEAGVEGEWDLFLWGGFAFSAIKKDGTYYIYYQGSSDYRTGFDETVLWRAIGVATSSDGIHFTKYQGNPILTWSPNQNGEEGAVSSGVTFGEQGEVMFFYGANTQESRATVNADIRAAGSLDGLNVTDLGVVLNHTDQLVWGSGDELFSVDAIYDSGQWIVYYIPNGSPETGKLGVAYGNQYHALDQTSMVTSDGNAISVWGTAGHVKLDQDTYALVLNNVRERRTEVRFVSLETPYKVSEPVQVYQFDEVQQAALLLDAENEIWFMYYRTPNNSYGVKLAPAGDRLLPTP